MLKETFEDVAGNSSPYATPKNFVNFVARCLLAANDAPPVVRGEGGSGSSAFSFPATDVGEPVSRNELGERGEVGLRLAVDDVAENAEGEDGVCLCCRAGRLVSGIGLPIGSPLTVGLGVRGTELDEVVDVDARGDMLGAWK